MRAKELYGNGYRVSKRMLARLEVLQAMCDEHNSQLDIYVDEYDFNLPIVLNISDSGYTVCHHTVYTEAKFLQCLNEQLVMLEAKS